MAEDDLDCNIYIYIYIPSCFILCSILRLFICLLPFFFLITLSNDDLSTLLTLNSNPHSCAGGHLLDKGYSSWFVAAIMVFAGGFATFCVIIFAHMFSRKEKHD